jgi:hypothetical protein
VLLPVLGNKSWQVDKIVLSQRAVETKRGAYSFSLTHVRIIGPRI